MRVSPLCLGAMMFGGFGNQDHDDCVRIVHRALDAGINFIDTADVYSAGESEEIVAKALAGGRRDDVILATKCHFPVASGPFDPNPEPNTYGSQPPPHHPGVRGQPAPPRHRLDRPLPGAPARLRPPTSTRRSAR